MAGFARKDPFELFRDTEQPQFDLIIRVNVNAHNDITIVNGRQLDNIAVKHTGHTISNERGSWTKLYYSNSMNGGKRDVEDSRELGMPHEILVMEHKGSSKVLRQGLQD